MTDQANIANEPNSRRKRLQGCFEFPKAKDNNGALATQFWENFEGVIKRLVNDYSSGEQGESDTSKVGVAAETKAPAPPKPELLGVRGFATVLTFFEAPLACSSADAGENDKSDIAVTGLADDLLEFAINAVAGAVPSLSPILDIAKYILKSLKPRDIKEIRNRSQIPEEQANSLRQLIEHSISKYEVDKKQPIDSDKRSSILRSIVDAIHTPEVEAKANAKAEDTSAADASKPQSNPQASVSAPKSTVFELTQLFGILTKSKPDKLGQTSFGFVIDGYVRNASDQVAYGAWARLDVLGPDGTQMLTAHLNGNTIKSWLADPDKIQNPEVEATADFERAVDKAEAPPIGQNETEVSGRLWLSTGEPLAQRTVAVFVPPSTSRLVDVDCVIDMESPDDDDCCDGSDISPARLVKIKTALTVTTTDESGNFAFRYPKKGFDCGSARLSVSGIALPIVVKLEGQDDRARQFPPRLLLEIDSRLSLGSTPDPKLSAWIEDKVDECSNCSDLKFDHSDQILEEFQFDILVRTTDPLIERAPIRPATSAARDFAAVVQDDSIAPSDAPVGTFFRTELTRNTPMNWDDDGKTDVRLAQAVTISHGRILTVRQQWRADGYSLGDLRYSLPLAPLQKKNIATVEWGRSITSTYDSSQLATESQNNLVDRERDISEIVSSAMNESIRGRSDSGSSSGSGGAGFSLFGIGFGGASAGSSSAWSSASQDAARNVSANFINRLRDQTLQAANAVRSQRVTTIQQVNENETARAVTETVANRNACHAITVQYFEVLRHFRVEHELAGVRECLYVPLPIREFDAPKILRWKDSLRAYLPEGNLRESIDAVQRLELALSGDFYPVTAEAPPKPLRYADEPLITLRAELQIILDFPLLDPNQATNEPSWNKALGEGFVDPTPLPDLYTQLKNLAVGDRAAFYASSIAPVLARKTVSMFKCKIDGVELRTTATLVSRYRAGERHIVEIEITPPSNLPRIDLRAIALVSPVDQHGADSVTVMIMQARFWGGTRHRAMVLADGPVSPVNLVRKIDEQLISTPTSPEDLRNPSSEDAFARDVLIQHLNNHIEFYHKAIWWTMDVDRRFALLDNFIAPNSGGRSVASVVENRLAGIIGNCIVMPVAPGIRLDYFEDNADQRGHLPKGDKCDKHNIDNETKVATPSTTVPTAGEDWLLKFYKPESASPFRISVPTRGVFAESVMGSCNSCERIDDKRNWRWWEHPLPDDTAIDPNWLTSRKPTTELQPNPVPAASIINQFAPPPAAPEPSGLAAALAAITNGNAFRDLAGLPGTQQNSRDALSGTFGVTQKFGELAAQIEMKKIDAVSDVVKAYLGMPSLPGKGSDGAQQRDSIKKDVAQGRLSDAQGKDLMHKSYEEEMRSQGGATAEPGQSPSVGQQALKLAGEDGRSVEYRDETSSVKLGQALTPPKRSLLSRLTGRGTTGSPPVAPRVILIEIVTEIRRPVSALIPSGEKSRQIVRFDSRSATAPSTVKLGSTYGIPATRNQFESEVLSSNSPRFSLWIKGQTASGVQLIPDIDYHFRVDIDLASKTLRVTGSIDAYPSYSMLVDGVNVFDNQQQSIVDLLGDADDVTVNFTYQLPH